MVDDRPVTGVRNPVCFASSLSYLRVKNNGPIRPAKRHLIFTTKFAADFAITSEPSPAAGGGALILNEKKY
jgi:hypothetical protein